MVSQATKPRSASSTLAAAATSSCTSLKASERTLSKPHSRQRSVSLTWLGLGFVSGLGLEFANPNPNLDLAAEEIGLRRQPELGKRLEEHPAELLRVVLPEGVGLAPAKRGGERPRRQRVPRAQLKLGKEPAKLQRHTAVLGAVQHRVVLEGVEALAQLRADEEPLHERV
jgi:hypothetical protein